MRNIFAALLIPAVVFMTGCEERVVSPDVKAPDQAIASADETLAKNGPPSAVTVTFGKDAGSPFPPDAGHDRSDHARDSMAPRTTVISVDGTVTFNIGPFHRVAVYEPGIGPDDIDVTDTVNLTSPMFIPNFVIDDSDGRLAVSWANANELSFAPRSWDYTFDTPGKYLVICTTLPHFAGADMYGWVVVK